MRKANTTNNTKPAPILFSAPFEIIRAKWNDAGTECRFSLRTCGISLYNIVMRYAKDTNEPWFSFPAWKTKDGKFLEYFYLKPDNDTFNAIVAALESM